MAQKKSKSKGENEKKNDKDTLEPDNKSPNQDKTNVSIEKNPKDEIKGISGGQPDEYLIESIEGVPGEEDCGCGGATKGTFESNEIKNIYSRVSTFVKQIPLGTIKDATNGGPPPSWLVDEIEQGIYGSGSLVPIPGPVEHNVKAEQGGGVPDWLVNEIEGYIQQSPVADLSNSDKHPVRTTIINKPLISEGGVPPDWLLQEMGEEEN